MKPEARRLYVVSGTKRVQEVQSPAFARREINVVQIDLPINSPLTGFRDAIKKKAQIAVVNIGRHEKPRGVLNGGEVVQALRRGSRELTIVTFSMDVPEFKIPGVHAHVQMPSEDEALEESVEELADVICKAPIGPIDFFPSSEFL